jgi:hypothetical protein
MFPRGYGNLSNKIGALIGKVRDSKSPTRIDG